MPAAVPYAWLRATIQAWPLASERAFLGAAITLDRAGLAALEPDVEEWLRTRARGHSLEALRQMRLGAWGTRAGADQSMRAYLGRLACRYLDCDGDSVRLRGRNDCALHDVAADWRWLSLLLPADLLVAACAARTGFDPPADHVALHDRGGDRQLTDVRHRHAVTHLHVGAALSYATLWAGLMRAVMLGALAPPGGDAAPPLAVHGGFGARLLEASVARQIMASFLWHRTYGDIGFSEFLAPAAPSRASLRDICALSGPRMQPQQMHRTLLAGLGALSRQCDAPTEAALRMAADLLARPQRAPVASLEDVEAMDPIAGWLPSMPGGASLETRFTAAALTHLARAPMDEVFARVFWQYQRVRCLTHRFLVLEPGTSGMDWFTAHYQRIGALRRSVDPVKYASALQLEGRGLHLGSLEARTSPSAHWHQVRDEVRELARNALDHLEHRVPAGQHVPEVGLVLHFLKNRGSTDQPYSSPRGTIYGCRFGRWFADREAEARAIVRAIDYNPELLHLLRGVDVANLELAVPTWAVLPLLRRTRLASREAAARLSARVPARHVHPLRVTMHAGEDFVRLSQGLRAMHEPIEFGGLRDADRIGHGIALGTSVAAWATSAAITVQPREERLDDLLWELDRYHLGQVTVEATRVELVRGEAQRHLHAIYGSRGRPVSVDAALVARRQRHAPRLLARLGYPRMARPDVRPHFPAGGWRDMLYRYLTDAGVHDRGTTPVEVPLHESELQFLERAQAWLARELTRRSITIETNPSSNLLIGDMVALENHPALRFQPLAGQRSATQVPVSVNTDDPISFATCLVDEYAHIYFALVRAHASSAEALDWLARARENGWRSRFTLAASAEREVLEEVARR